MNRRRPRPRRLTAALAAAELQEANQARLAALEAQGHQVNVVGPYVAALADFLLPEGDRRRLEFALIWERQLAGMLDDLDSALARATLTEGVTR